MATSSHNFRVVAVDLNTCEVNEIVEITVSDIVDAGHKVAEFVENLHEGEDEPDQDQVR